MYSQLSPFEQLGKKLHLMGFFAFTGVVFILSVLLADDDGLFGVLGVADVFAVTVVLFSIVLDSVAEVKLKEDTVVELLIVEEEVLVGVADPSTSTTTSVFFCCFDFASNKRARRTSAGDFGEPCPCFCGCT